MPKKSGLTHGVRVKLVDKNKNDYGTRTVEDVKLITHNKKIVVPTVLRQRIVAWYHEYLVHPGSTRMEATLKQNLTWPNLKKDVEQYVRTCHKCQKNKQQRKKYGHLPTKVAETSVPWNRVNVDMIGPYTIQTPTKKHHLRAITMIDPATGWFEVKDITDASANTCMSAFDDTWLSRYPRPQFIGFDNGNEYKNVFREMCTNYGIKPKPSTTYNPQSNGIIERVHQVLGNALRTFELEERELDPRDPFSSFLAAASYAIRSMYHTTLQATPAQLIYGRDMILPIQFKTDWESLRANRQKEMTRNNVRENQRRIDHTYKINDLVMLTKPGIKRKMSTPRDGPYNIIKINKNGTIRIQKDAIAENVNIRRMSPYHAHE